MITRKVIETIKQGKKCSITETLTQELEAQVFLVPQKNGCIKVRARLMRKNPCEHVAYISDKTKKIKTFEELEHDCRAVCNSLLAAYNNSKRHKQVENANPITIKDFRSRVLSVPDIYNPRNYDPYTKRGWGESTARKAVAEYISVAGKVYAQYGEEATESEFQAFFDSEIDRIYTKTYKDPCTDDSIIRRRKANIYNNYMDRMGEALAVQKFLIDHNQEGNWPATLIPVEAHYRAPKAEEIKAIEYKQYIQLCTILKLCCESEIPEAYGAALEVICGARVSESGAPLVGELAIIDTIGRYYIDYQLDGAGGRVNTLKRANSRRYVVFGDYFIQLIRMRKSQLKGHGYTDCESDKMPFAADLRAPNTFLTGNRISAFLRHLLILVGCDEKWLESEAERLHKIAKVNGTAEDLDVAAHLLRRTLATYWCNGGVPVGYVDAQLGHDSVCNKGIDFASLDTARIMVSMMERCIYLGKLCATLNPAYTPVRVEKTAGYHLKGNTKYRFVVVKDMWLEIDVNALEPSRDIYIKTSNKIGTGNLLLRCQIDTIESRRERPILPMLPGREEVDRWIDSAVTVDVINMINSRKNK